ncbi:tungstate/molybdate binding protein [Peptoclostridium litorale DSM 5388]|uniref:Tungstate ABC transporter binding protein WtpA n=1 Tax=Peptoclostridium litorale DSM 5388 TaxID=1121324 RepID=A0A069RML5_PEPLI|nr:tungstate ABC transporter substrate-binding protein WtpA [Peptoclostridium litorale]KDR95432.1 tungstate ABC transporter binding protein WtpA [Peptoclostridium litorale DSM 5388]SIO18878.1 tungstate/molybdate binding protein [Peptoclostridium litorale DSM 5388]
MKFSKKLLGIFTALLMASTFALAGCGQGEESLTQAANAQQEEDSLQGDLVVYHAGSLSVPFEALEKRFEELHPGVDVQRTPGGSRKIARQITELGDKVDVLCSADYTVIDTLVMPEFASWNALFAENSMVIMYSKDSKYAGEIDADNWYDVITRDGVNYGHSDPNADPCGYRSVLLWQLAEKHYGKDGINQKLVDSCKAENIRPKSVELIAMLETGALDYAFEYESVAIQHAKKNPDLDYVKLPMEINLSSLDYKDFYANATIELDGKEPGEKITKKGEPIVYSLTMPNTGENSEAAVEFLKFLFDEKEGVRILKEEGQPVLDAVNVFGEENIPEGLSESI